MSSLSPRGGVKGSGRGVPARGVLAALLLLLAGLKLSAPGATALSTGVAVAECVLALLLLFARTAQWGGLVGIGGFVGAGAAHGAITFSTGGTGPTIKSGFWTEEGVNKEPLDSSNTSPFPE